MRTIPGCCALNASARAVSLRAQPSSGSPLRAPPAGGELQLCAWRLSGPGPGRRSLQETAGTVDGITKQEPARPDNPDASRSLLDDPRLHDLARLARNGLISRRPLANTYDLTPDELKFAIFSTKVRDWVVTRLFTPGNHRRCRDAVSDCAPSNSTSTRAKPPQGCHPRLTNTAHLSEPSAPRVISTPLPR